MLIQINLTTTTTATQWAAATPCAWSATGLLNPDSTWVRPTPPGSGAYRTSTERIGSSSQLRIMCRSSQVRPDHCPIQDFRIRITIFAIKFSLNDFHLIVQIATNLQIGQGKNVPLLETKKMKVNPVVFHESISKFTCVAHGLKLIVFNWPDWV